MSSYRAKSFFQKMNFFNEFLSGLKILENKILPLYLY